MMIYLFKLNVMGLKKRIKKLEKEREEIMGEITDINVKEIEFIAQGAHGLDEILRLAEEKSILMEKTKSIENEILANKFELNCIKGTLLMMAGLFAFMIFKYVIL